MDFAQRSAVDELMDTQAVSFEEFDQCLRHLRIINAFTLAYRPTIQWLSRKVSRGKDPVSVLDIGCGGGDMLRRIAGWAKRRGLCVELVGVDMHPWSTRSAQRATPSSYPIRYETADIFAFMPERKADFIISSLFAHHLSDSELVRFIHWMECHAARGWFINDVERHPLAYALVRRAVKLLRFNRLVQHDAPVSVLRALKRSDWQRLLGEAGVPPRQVTIDAFFPFRYGIGRSVA